MQNLDSSTDTKLNIVELLAPVGDMNSLKQAVFGGANAVYFGYKNFNARRKAENFSNLKEVTDFCHLYGVRAYLALNTSLKDSELAEVEEIVKESIAAKIDAYIICDLTLISIIRKYDKNAELHASTQMGIHNIYGAMFAKDLGFSRIILSRETTLKDIEEIKKNVDISLEYFVQGALCVAFSGACLFSSMLSGNSGNRGLCGQLCRQKYSFDGNSSYLLSPKDLCLAKRLKELKTAGITSFKIEGRLRRYEYVANAVSVYRKILDSNDYANNNDIEKLKKLFNRGDYTEGYIFDDKKNIICEELNGHKGVFFAKVERIVNDRIQICPTKEIDENDGFKILCNGYEVGSCTPKNLIQEKNIYYLKYNGEIEVGDSVYRTTDYKYNQSLIKDKKLDVSIKIILTERNPTQIFARSNNIEAEFSGNIVSTALNAPITKYTIFKQLNKTSDTQFNINGLDIVADDNIFVPISELNSLRREVLNLLQTRIIKNFEDNKVALNVEFSHMIKNRDAINKLPIMISELVEIDKIVLNNSLDDKIVIINPSDYNTLDAKSILNYKQKYNTMELYLNLPIFASHYDLISLEKLLSNFDGVLANNYYGITLAEKYEKGLILGNNMNIFNSKNPLISISNMFIPSVELSNMEFKALDNSKMHIYAYGYLPLMYLKVCYNQILNMASCATCNKNYSLYIEDNKERYLIKNQSICDCNHILYNPIITDIGTDNKYKYFLDLTLDKEYNIIDEYCNKCRKVSSKHTKNHLNRGVN